ncbi:MAG: siderophore-interacting protein [Bacteroidota bacterium]
MASGIKKAIFKLMDKALTQEGYVLNINKWEPALYEVDLHLPSVNMRKWESIHRIKCRVADFEYRDYTPATWDAEKSTCKIWIEAAHKGSGSAWVKNLHAGDTVLFAPAYAAPLPNEPGKILCVGDGTALGHFLALKHLTKREAQPLEVIVYLNEDYDIPVSFKEDNPEFQFITKSGLNMLDTLYDYAVGKQITSFTSIQIVGNIPMVQGLRKMFKSNPYLNARIFAHGFWK